MRDAESVGASENLYVLSELAGLVVRRWAKGKGWVVSTYPKKVKLPADVFRALPTPEAANEVRLPIPTTLFFNCTDARCRSCGGRTYPKLHHLG